MVEKFINTVTSKLYGRVPDEYLRAIQTTLQVELDKYELTLKETSLVPYQGVLPECYKSFMVSKKIEGKSEKTLKNYKLYIEHMFNTMQLQIRDISPNAIKVYLYNIQQSRGVSNRSLNSRRSVLHGFFTWCAAEGYIDKNPMATIRPIKYEAKEQKPLDDTELELVRSACSDIREKAMIEFLYSTGCRVTEMERVNREDVNFSTQEVKLFGKGNKHRTSYLTAKSILLLQQYLETRSDDNPALFVYLREPHERMKKSGIEKVIGAIGDRAGIPRLHPHLIRHTTATNCLQRGMDVTQVQQLLGHANINTTMIYAKASAQDLQRNHKKYLT